MKFNKFFSRHNISRFGPAVLSALIAVEAFITAALMLQHSSESAGSAVFGNSLPRILIVGFLVILTLLAAGVSITLFKSEERTKFIQNWITNPAHRSRSLWTAILIGSLAWISFFAPAYRLGGYAGYVVRLQPLFVLVILIALETTAFIHLQTKPTLARKTRVHEKKAGSLAGWGFIMAIILLAWTLIALTGLGIRSNGEDYWYEAGVPLLTVQVLVALLIGLTAALISARGKKSALPPKPDLFIFLAIWFLAGLIWVNTPAPNGYFNPGPFPPTHEAYPFSDAARFDVQSQFALLGQGLNDGRNLARPLYPAFLVLMHVLAGQDYELIIDIQTAIFSIFPALIYLIGKTLYNRSVGLAAAAVILLRGVNSIAATAILNLANPKQLLSDFPTAIGIALSLLLCILWLKSPGKLRLPLLAGAALLFTSYARLTVLGALPAILLLSYLVYRKFPKAWLMAGLALFAAGYIVASAPWEIRSNIGASNGFVPSGLQKIMSVLARYLGPQQPLPTDVPSGVPPQWEWDVDLQQWNNSDWDEGYYSSPIATLQRSQLDVGVLANHFARSVITSILTLPDSFELHDLRTTVKAENSYWSVRWDGSLTAGRTFLLGLNLCLLGLGLLTAWKRNGFAGLLPGGFFLGYHLANSLARTSGGRYVVPVDWIVALYFMIGLMQAALWCLQTLGLLAPAGAGPSTSRSPGPFRRDLFRTAAWPAIGLLLIGLLLVLPDLAFPRVYARVSVVELSNRIAMYSPDQVTPEQRMYINDLLDEGGIMVVGKIMYPRYSPRFASGELFLSSVKNPEEYPVLVFSLIGPNGLSKVRLVGPLSDNIPQLSEAIVIGCRQDDHLEAATVILSGPPVRIYERSPWRLPHCPLPEPVCDQNGNCQ